MEIAQESAAIQRARAKLERVFEEQKIQPEDLDRVKQVTRAALANNQAEREVVTGKRSLALFAANTDIAPVSAAVENLFKRLKS